MSAEASRRALWLLLGIVTAGAALRLFFAASFTCYDEFHYAHIIRNLSLGNFTLADASGFYGFRYLLTVPAAGFAALFGFGERALAVWPLLCSLGTIGAAFFIGRRLFGESSGLVAAFLYAVFPLSVVYGTILYPEEILAFFAAISVLFFLKAEDTSGRRAALLYAVCGIFCGFAYFSRISALILLVFYAAYGLFGGWRPARLLVLAGLAAILLPEAGLNLAKTGNALFSWDAQQLKLAADAASFSSDLLIYPMGMLGANAYGLGLFGFFFHLFSGCALVFLFKLRHDKAWVPLLWFACIFLYLEFGPARLPVDGYEPAHKQLRFISLAALPAALFSARYLAGLRVGYGAPLAGFMLLTSLAGAAKMSKYYHLQAAPYKLAYQYVREGPPGDVFVPDEDWRARLDFYYSTPLSEPYYPFPSNRTLGVRDLGQLTGRGAGPAWVITGVRPQDQALGSVSRAIPLGGGMTLYRLDDRRGKRGQYRG